jgi:hypothetical protein
MARDGWTDGTDEEQVRRVVSSLLRLANSDDASRILGVDGTLEDEVDVTFLSGPLEWIASEIASALRQAEEDDEENSEEESEQDTSGSTAASLSTLVALVRLYRIATGETLGERALSDAVIEYLSEEEEE